MTGPDETLHCQHKASYNLYEWPSGRKFGPASEENLKAFTEALQAGKRFISYPYHGYTLSMTVEKERTK